MSTEKTEKNDREVSLTRRTLIKTAAWTVPVILTVGLPSGNVFAQGSNGPDLPNDLPNDRRS